MSVAAAPGRAVGDRRRFAFLAGTVGLTAAAFAVTIAMAPAAGAEPVRALGWLLFIGSSVHVASTAWFYAVPEVRAHMATHRRRYVVVPLTLIAAPAAVAAALPQHQITWLLHGIFG